jgi:hypothetical protein
LASDAVKSANGGKPVISQKTSIEALQSLFGVNDVDEELRRIEDEAATQVEFARAVMDPGPDQGFPPPRAGGQVTQGPPREDRGEG